MQKAVCSVQEVHLFLGVVPVISHKLPDDRIVLLFHMGVVVLVIRTGPGEGDPPDMAEVDEMSGRGLTPVIRMQGQDPPWVPVEAGCQCSNHRDLYFRAYGPPPRSIRWDSR